MGMFVIMFLEPDLVVNTVQQVRWPGVRFTNVFRTELGHKYILVECSVIALCLPVVSKLSLIKSCAINRTMIGMSIKRISVLNLCHVLKPFVKPTPGVAKGKFRKRAKRGGGQPFWVMINSSWGKVNSASERHNQTADVSIWIRFYSF